MNRAGSGTPVIGIAGWKKSGKTTLAERLIAEFTRRGLKVASVKHAHHNFRVDDAETDSARHRRAGASQVAIVSAKRWALIAELEGAPEPDLTQVIAQLDRCDLVIVEGYKSAPIPKIEVRRRAALGTEPLADKDPGVIAIAADHAADGQGRPVFALDEVVAIADFVAESIGLPAKGVSIAADAPAKS
jgi:molybdopterin-guanine dinucleotide biosynthesis adapter protein